MLNESEIWRAFQLGDAKACTALYNLFVSDLYNYGMKFAGDAALVEDAIHDLFVTLWTSRERLSHPASVRNYLFKALRTGIFKKLKQKNLLVGEDEASNFQFDITIADKLCQNEQFIQVKREVDLALAKLTPRQREIIYYRFYQNLGFDEIADIMGMEVRATYKLTARALKTLRELMPVYKLCAMYYLVAHI